MKRFTILTIALTLLLILAACGGTTAVEPAADTAPAAGDAMADDKMTDDAMADDAMADDKMTDDTMADDAMADDKMTDDTMADDAMADDKMTDDAMVGDEPHDDTMAATEDETMMDDADKMDASTAVADLPVWQTLSLTDARTGESYTFADFNGKTVFVEPMATWCTNCRRQLGDVSAARAALEGQDVVFVALSVETVLSGEELAAYADGNGWGWTFSVLTEEALQALVGEFGQSVANPPATPHFIIRPDGSVTALATGFESADELVAQIQAAMQ